MSFTRASAHALDKLRGIQLFLEKAMPVESDLLTRYATNYDSRRTVELSIPEYLEACKTDPTCYAGAHERLLAAIGEPVVIDTAKDPRLGRIFMNRTIRQYPAFSEFFGMEETVERIVSFFRHAACKSRSNNPSQKRPICLVAPD